MEEKFVRWSTLQTQVGLSRTTIWRMERAGCFPRRRQLSSNSVAWLQSEVEHWKQSRVSVGVQS
ncbi:MAG: AlpA family phage regulatory protein [Proteobacteria bacterium]|nr:AlpA family phage regulatory protein [Pseudomonadota bacterium]